jgi:DNA-binding transcriptional ArsR family regulator
MAIKQRKLCKVSADLELMVDRAKQATGFLKGLSQESRLLILCFLSEGENSVTNLEELLALRQSTVSQQLARLRLDGLVKTKRDGKTIYYNLACQHFRSAP